MKSSILLSACLFIFLFSLQAQKQIEHQDFDSWKRIRNEQISNNGKYVVYHLAPGKGDQILKISSHEGKELLSYTRGESSRFTFDSKYVIFTIKPGQEIVNEFRRKKTKPEDMPKDSLGIFNLQTEKLSKIGNVKSWKVPEKWNGYVVYQSTSLPSDTLTVKTDKKAKKNNQENGFPLLIHNLNTGVSDSIEFVTDYQLAKENDKLIYTTSGVPGKLEKGVYFSDISDKTPIPLLRAKGVFKSLTFDNKGDQVAFLCDLDTTKTLARDFQLRYWSLGMDSAQLKVNTSTSGMQDNWMVSEHGILRFSDNATMLFFGTTPKLVLQDTSRLSEEIINVEVWHYKDKRLYTQQNVEINKDQKKNYQAVFHILSNKMVQLADEEVSQIKTTFNWDATLIMGFSDLRYQREFSWEGWSKEDLYLIDVQTGSKKLIKEGVQGFSNLSSGGNYINWFDQTDSTYYAYHIASGKINNLSSAIKTSLVEELHDSPILPYPYGFVGNTKNDEAILIYDRYDIWSLDPQNQKAPIRLTQGRESKTQYRYVHLDPEDPTIDISEMFIHSFNETSKKEGYAILSGKNKKLNSLITEDFHFTSPIKAMETQDIIFTKESFRVFPDLMASNFKFKKPVRISQANPEQSGYSWGSIELYNWISLDGEPLQGLLYKPQNFDPKKKYPLLTSFYERNSDNLNRHWGIVPHRSTINPTFYTSRGYVVFVPDIPYKMGYPGESCFNAVIPGVTSLIGEGYVDREKLGVQGHSWGGYQIAYLLTRTNMFTAAGSGAPVVNMISAYGGIRWGTGLSRMFQYEKTQSRIGGTLWEYPLRFMENSPIFFMDKVTTPVLILHNDNDAAVPWYQGIEMFTALRRLDKPAWMLNYNGEPHWPTKWENIRDYNIRLQQFFDYYLMGQPAPQWLEEGVPALMKGIDNGLELQK